ncbi:MAG: restriction endonuclease subunit S [Bacteroidales bacterium]|nr:restriction endonuclease subunit S [Bacteroidales bacterium]
MTEWKEYKLGDLCTKIGDGLHGTPVYENRGEYYFINGNNLVNGKIKIKEDTKKVNESEYLKHAKPINERTLLLGINGTIGNVAYYKNEKFILGKSACYMNLNDEVDLNFIYYTLINKDFQNYIEEIATGTTILNVPLKGLREYSFKIPPLPEQTAIAAILSSLDDKIDLLHRQNATLEKMAEALFRQWFVEEAKEDWETKKVKEVCSVITKGTTPTTFGKQFKETGINFIKAESLTDVGGFIHNKFAFIDFETDEMLKRSRIQKGDILITIAGTIGRIAYTTEDILPANTNQAIGIMRVNNEIIHPYFLYCLFRTSEIRDDFDGRVVHSVQPNLSLGEIGNIEYKMPPKENLDSGMNRIIPLFQKKEKNQTQIRTLTTLRDTLLPKLMSGEVKVVNNVE